MKLAVSYVAKYGSKVCKYFLSGLLILSVLMLMTGVVMPTSVSLYIDYLGFSDDAPILAIAFMGGVPLIFLAGCYVYGTVKFLNFSCRYILNYFDGLETELARKIDLMRKH